MRYTLILLLALLLAGCQAPAATASPTAVAIAATATSAVPTAPIAPPTATSAPTAISTPTPAATRPVAATTPITTTGNDVFSQSLDALAKLNSYEVVLLAENEGDAGSGNTISRLEYRWAAETRWAISATITTISGSQQINLSRIDNTVYIKNPANDQWIESASTVGQTTFDQFRLDIQLRNLVPVLQASAARSPRQVGNEQVNGVPTVHWNETISNYRDATMTVDKGTFDLWVAQNGGYPVRLNFAATGTRDSKPTRYSARLDLTNANGNIKVEPPPADKITRPGGTRPPLTTPTR